MSVSCRRADLVRSAEDYLREVLRLRCTAAIVAVTAVVVAMSTPVSGQAYRAPRTADGKPDLNGIWQALNTANSDLQDHVALPGVPASTGVVEGNEIPYQPWAAAKKKENLAQRATADPLAGCFLPGVPRATYLPFPFQIAQTPRTIAVLYTFRRTPRLIYTDGSKHPEGLEYWMGDSRARWEGDTLVVDVTNFNDKTWFDNAGNFHSEALHVTERYTRTGPDHLLYEATIEDPKVFTRPWKISMPLYRRLEKNVQILEYECVEFLEGQAAK
jgi:hypothetical protein